MGFSSLEKGNASDTLKEYFQVRTAHRSLPGAKALCLSFLFLICTVVWLILLLALLLLLFLVFFMPFS